MLQGPRPARTRIPCESCTDCIPPICNNRSCYMRMHESRTLLYRPLKTLTFLSQFLRSLQQIHALKPRACCIQERNRVRSLDRSRKFLLRSHGQERHYLRSWALELPSVPRSPRLYAVLLQPSCDGHFPKAPHLTYGSDIFQTILTGWD